MKGWKTIFEKKVIIFFSIGLFCGWGISFFLININTAKLRGDILRLDENNSFEFIDPLLACNTGSETLFPEFRSIKDHLNSYVNKVIKNGDVTDVSIYLRSMKSGRWFVIGGDEKYAPASLLKTFIMLAYFIQSEQDEGLLNKQIIFKVTKNSDSEDNYNDWVRLVEGKKYSIEDLIRHMIIYSDNSTMNVLIDNLDDRTIKALTNVFTDLNITQPNNKTEESMDFMSVDSYATIFRVLYGGTYLSRENSEKALEILSKVSYKEGIVAGLPLDYVVAHKFGIRTITEPFLKRELHDCGIIYYPNHPYLLCVMTRGDNFTNLQSIIQNVSRLAYKDLSSFFEGLAK